MAPPSKLLTAPSVVGPRPPSAATSSRTTPLLLLLISFAAVRLGGETAKVKLQVPRGAAIASSGGGGGADANANATTEEDRPSFERQWPRMKRAMCPDMIPNPNLFPILFELARTELGLPLDKIKSHRRDETAVERFYKFNMGGLGYLSFDGVRPRYTAYLRIFKAGNDRIRLNLNDLLGKSGGVVWERRALSELFSQVPPAWMNDTCVVTAVRDPIEHFLSGYNEIEWRYHTRMMNETAIRGSTKVFPAYRRLPNGTTTRFEKFATDFVTGPKSYGIYRGDKPSGQIEDITHVFSMVGPLWGLRRLDGCRGDGDAVPRLAAYLPDLSGLDGAFPRMLHRTCQGLPPVGRFRKGVAHQSQYDEYGFRSAAERVWREGGSVPRALCAIHAMDYACYDIIPVPGFCREVYARRRFQEGVLGALVSNHSMASEGCGDGNFP